MPAFFRLLLVKCRCTINIKLLCIALIGIPDDLGSDLKKRTTTLHEFGHAFGWDGHSTGKNDVMTSGVDGGTVSILTPDDVAQIRQFYP